eukprot:4787822-Lingulodinium_polyedra.AAC.1
MAHQCALVEQPMAEIHLRGAGIRETPATKPETLLACIGTRLGAQRPLPKVARGGVEAGGVVGGIVAGSHANAAR